MIGCDLANTENKKQAKCNINMETVCQNLDFMSKLNLMHSKTQVCIVQYYLFVEIVDVVL